MPSLRVSSLTVYPIKSCRGTSIMSSVVEARGLVGDRLLMVVNWQGEFLTQREYPRLALVHPRLHGAGLALSAPGMAGLDFQPTTAGETTDVVVWSDSCVGVDQGQGVAEWFSDYLTLPCRLVRISEQHPRRVDPNFAISPRDQVAFSDGFPLLLISTASLADLNQKIGIELPMDRFRPNIVVDGCEPYAEDGWRQIQIGGLSFEVVKPCARCAITTVDQTTAERGKEPLATLGSYRLLRGLGVVFGQNVIPHGTGTISVGDAVLPSGLVAT